MSERALTFERWAPHHTPAIIELIGSVFAEYGMTFDPDGWDSDLQHIGKHYLDQGGRFDVLLDGERVVGTVAVERRNATTCEIKRVYLRAEYRGQGHGRALMEHILRWITETGYRTAIAWSDIRFATAHQMYRRLGFELIGERQVNDADRSREYGFRREIGP